MPDLSKRLSDALGRAIVSYPFMVMALTVVVAIEASRETGGRDLVGWLLWALLWVGIAAVAAGFLIVPILAAEMLLWEFVIDRYPWLDSSWTGVILSSAMLAAPWALAPRSAGWGGPVLLFMGLLLARMAVPSLRPGRPLPQD